MTAGGFNIGSAQSGIEGWDVTREQLDRIFEDIYGAQYGADAVELAHKISECEAAYNQLDAEYKNAADAISNNEITLGRNAGDIQAELRATNAELGSLRQEQANLSRMAEERYRSEYLPRSELYHAERGHYNQLVDFDGVPHAPNTELSRNIETELRSLQREITVTEQRISHLNHVMCNPTREEEANRAVQELCDLEPKLEEMQQKAATLSQQFDIRDGFEINSDARTELRNTNRELRVLDDAVQNDPNVVRVKEKLRRTGPEWECRQERQDLQRAYGRETGRIERAQGETRTDLIARNQRARSTMEAREANFIAERTKAREAENARLLAQQSEAREAKKWSCNPSRAVIVGGLVAVAAGALLFMFVPGSPLNVSGDKKSPHHSGDSAADPQDAFAASGGHIQGFHENTQGISSRDAWTGGASSGYAVNNAGMGNLAEHIAATNQAVDGIVQTQAEQVTTGRRTVADAFDGLQLAMPASDSLYLSGPAGPAMSYSFQLAATSSAVSTGIDTAQKMHDDSRNHAARLTELAEQYDEALRQIPSAGTASSTRTAA